MVFNADPSIPAGITLDLANSRIHGTAPNDASLTTYEFYFEHVSPALEIGVSELFLFFTMHVGCDASCSVSDCAACCFSTVCTDCNTGFALGVEDGSTCVVDTCGDGKNGDAAVGICDDGNNVDGDGCSSTCAVESGWTCTLGDDFTASI